MYYSFSRRFKVVCCILIASLIVGMLPWRELSADANTHGKYTAKPFEITYEQNSTWGNSTQGQFVVKNTSKNNVKSWVLEIDYAGDVRLSNIWNAKDITNYNSDKNIKVSCNTAIPAGQTYTFGLIADGAESAPTAPVAVKVIKAVTDEPQLNKINQLKKQRELSRLRYPKRSILNQLNT